jgi:D-alanyl-D-alanine carboxypeptidase
MVTITRRDFALTVPAMLLGCAGAAPRDDTYARMEKEVDGLLAAGLGAGMLLTVVTPTRRYEHAFGRSNTYTGEPTRMEMAWRIGSNTKPFVATAALMLVDEKKVALDDPIAKYLDGVPHGNEITVRMLGDMSSGVPNYTDSKEFYDIAIHDLYRAWNPTELTAMAFRMTDWLPPGTHFRYSNSSTVLLGLLLEKIDRKPLAQVLRDRIFAPLGMDRTFLPVGAEFPQPRMSGYTKQVLAEVITDATLLNPSWAWAAGGIISTSVDMTKWAPVLAKGGLLSAQTQAERLKGRSFKPDAPEDLYMNGMFTVSGWRGHNGGLPGYTSYAVHSPALGTTVVLVVNSDVAAQGGRTPASVMIEHVTGTLFPGRALSI